MFFEKTETVTISIEGMHCNHCKAKVENALKSIKGVKKVDVSLENARATVIFAASKTNADAMIAKINESGFNASQK